jgi:uncharacterized protein
MAPVAPASCCTAHRDGTALQIRLQPRARRTGVVGVVGERLKIAVSGPPVDGKANAELCRFLADTLGVPKSAVAILRGETSREKSVLVRGLVPAQVRERLGLST